MKALWLPVSNLVKVHYIYMPNIKAVGLPVSEEKNFEVGLLWSYVRTCDPTRAGTVLTTDASYE